MLIKQLSLKNVFYKINNRNILSKINLSIKNDEKIAIIGPSGSGKTTLLKIIAHAKFPSRGEIKINELNLLHLKKKDIFKLRKSFFMIPQQFSIPSRLRVYRAIQTGYLAEWSTIKSVLSVFYPFNLKKIHEILKRFSLETKIDEKVESLSGGEKQCINIARLLVTKAKMLLLDEPMAGIDIKKIDLVMKNLLEFQSEHKSLLIISLHQLEIVQKYFTRVICMKHGKIKFDLPIKKVTKKIIKDLYE